MISADVKRLLAVCPNDLSGPAGPAGLRDWALFPVGLAGAFRRSELVGIDVVHLRFEKDGVVVRIPRSKAGRRGADIVLPRIRGEDTSAVRETCPVAALEHCYRQGFRRGPCSGGSPPPAPSRAG